MTERNEGYHDLENYEAEKSEAGWEHYLTGSQAEAARLYEQLGQPLLQDENIIRLASNKYRQLRSNLQISELLGRATQETEQLALSSFRTRNRKRQVFGKKLFFEPPQLSQMAELSIPELIFLLHRFEVLADPKVITSYHEAHQAVADQDEYLPEDTIISSPRTQEVLTDFMKDSEPQPNWEQTLFSDTPNPEGYTALVLAVINNQFDEHQVEEEKSSNWVEDIVNFAKTQEVPFHFIHLSKALGELLQQDNFQQLCEENTLSADEQKLLVRVIADLYLDIAMYDLRRQKGVVDSSFLPFRLREAHIVEEMKEPKKVKGKFVSQAVKAPVTPYYLATLPQVINKYILSIPDSLRKGAVLDRKVVEAVLREAQKLILDQLEVMQYSKSPLLTNFALKTFGQDLLNDLSLAEQFELTRNVRKDKLTSWQKLIMRINAFLTSYARHGGWIRSSQDAETPMSKLLDTASTKREGQKPTVVNWSDLASSINHFGGKQRPTKRIRYSALANRGNI